MSKHTPGPWIIDDDCGLSVRPDDKSAPIIADLVIQGDSTEPGLWGSELDNARLIAAAPELLEALKAAQEELRLIRMKDTNAVYNIGCRSQISAAIAKAEGRT